MKMLGVQVTPQAGLMFGIFGKLLKFCSIMLHTFKYSSVEVLLLLVGCILVLGCLTNSKSNRTFQIRGVEFVGTHSASQGEICRGFTGPVFVKETEHSPQLNFLDISFEFSTQDPTFSYGNLFQTGDSLDAIRMELQPSSNLVIVLGEGKLFHLSKSIQIGTYSGIRLKYERNQVFKVFINEIEVLNITDKSVLSGKFDMSNIVVGAGLASQRTLFGSVKSFNLNCVYSYYNRTAMLSRWGIVILCGIVFLISLPRGPIAEVTIKGSNALPTTSHLADIIAVYGFSLFFVTMSLCTIYYFGERHLGLLKWFAHLILPVSLATVVFVIIRHRWGAWKWARWPFCAIFLAYTVYIIISIGCKPRAYDVFILCMFLFSLLAFGLSLARTTGVGFSLPHKDEMPLAFSIAIGISGLFLTLSWCTLVDLTNWNAFKQILDNNFGVVIVGVFLVLRIVVTVVFGSENCAGITAHSSDNGGKTRSLVWLHLAVIAVFLWISFRHDSLFIPGSEYHWEYYIGVVQGIRNGGWLLWDTPSQYGFLNILLASLIPSASSWQSFYIFQGILLFLVSTGIYLAARRYIYIRFPPIGCFCHCVHVAILCRPGVDWTVSLPLVVGG